MNLIQDDQLAFVLRKVPGGVGELGALILVLKIQVDRGLLLTLGAALARPRLESGEAGDSVGR